MKPFARIELLQAVNCKVLSINMTRVSSEKGYGLMSVIAAFDVATGDILDAIEADRPAREEPEPARWLHRKRNGYAVLVCSACEKQKEGYTHTAYCPNCGRPVTGGEAQGCE